MTEMMNIYSEKESENIASSSGLKLIITKTIDKTAAFFFKLCSSHLMKTSRDSYEIILPTYKHPLSFNSSFPAYHAKLGGDPAAYAASYLFTAAQIVHRSFSAIGEWAGMESSI